MQKQYKRLKELLDVPTPEAGKAVGWDESGYPVNLTVTGAPGLSAYEVALSQGFVGTEQEWLLSLKGSSEAKTPIDVFGCAGQSNMVGRAVDWLGNSPIPQSGTAYEVYQGAIYPLIDPIKVNVSLGYGSALPAFAIEYYNLTGRKVCLINAAIGGSGLTVAGNAGSNWSDSGALFSAAIASYQSAMSVLSAAGYEPRFRGVLWSQGESDASAINSAALTEADYKTALAALVHRFQVYYPKAHLFIIQTGNMADSFGSVAGFDTVRKVQQEVVNENADNQMVCQSCVTYKLRGLLDYTGAHYTQAAYNEIGTISARSIAAQNQIDNAIPSNRVFRAAADNVGIGDYAGRTIPAKLAVKGNGISTGSAMVVQDAAEKTNIVVQDNGYVGIGTPTPKAILHNNLSRVDGSTPDVGTVLYNPTTVDLITAEERAAQSDVIVAASGNGGFSAIYRGVRAGGTLVSPTPPLNGDAVASYMGGVYTGAGVYNTAAMSVYIDGTVDATHAPTKITFRTKALGDVTAGYTDWLTIRTDGKIGVNTTTPTEQFDVNGTVKTTGLRFSDNSLQTSAVSVYGGSGKVQVSNGSGGLSYSNNCYTTGDGTLVISNLLWASGGDPQTFVKNNLTDPSTDKALSAGAGKSLSERVPVLPVGSIAVSNGTVYTNDTALSWDAANKRLGIGSVSTANALELNSSADSGAGTTGRAYNTSTGANASASWAAKTDTSQVSITAHGAGRTATRYGTTIGSYTEVIAAAGNGLMIGTNTLAAPVIFGNNSLERLRITPDGAIKIAGTSTALPTASGTYRGAYWLLLGAAGVSDKLYMCLKKADDSYVWKLSLEGV